jgi:hypothetical protein
MSEVPLCLRTVSTRVRMSEGFSTRAYPLLIRFSFQFYPLLILKPKPFPFLLPKPHPDSGFRVMGIGCRCTGA